jgi:uncharacterized protein
MKTPRTSRLAALFVVLSMPLLVHAASFDCGKAAGATEKAICANASLSSQDSELASAWKKVRAQHGDEATLQAQRDWIAQRNACGGDTACLSKRYAERLAALGNASAGEAPAPRFQQQWRMESPSGSIGSTLAISGDAPLHFSFSGWNGANSGELSGDATQDSHTHAHYELDGCTLDFFLRDGKLVVEEKEDDNGGCGAGMGVSYAGSYVTKKTFASKPKPDLHTLHVVGSSADDATLRKLLGKDYAELLADVNMIGTDTADGTTITQLWVRGIASTNAAIVMDSGHGEFHVGLLVFDQHKQLRMRYYTNVAQDRNALPKPIRDWHDQIDPTIPIDMMR